MTTNISCYTSSLSNRDKELCVYKKVKACSYKYNIILLIRRIILYIVSY